MSSQVTELGWNLRNGLWPVTSPSTHGRRQLPHPKKNASTDEEIVFDRGLYKTIALCARTGHWSWLECGLTLGWSAVGEGDHESDSVHSCFNRCVRWHCSVPRSWVSLGPP